MSGPAERPAPDPSTADLPLWNLAMSRSQARRQGGRPNRLTVAVALALVRHVGQGEPLEDAARRAGIGPSTLWRWLAAGRAGDPRFVALVRGAQPDTAGQRTGARLARPTRPTWGSRVAPSLAAVCQNSPSDFEEIVAAFCDVLEDIHLPEPEP